MDIEDFDRLRTYLIDLGKVDAREMLAISKLAGGVSNRTVLVRRETGEAWVLKQALRRLRVRVEWYSDPARIEREALALQLLPRLLPPASTAEFVFFDPEQHVLAMHAVPEPHENFKTLLLAGHIDPNHVRTFAEMLAAIHARGAADAELRLAFAERSFFESLRVEPYYAYTAKQVPEAADFYERLIAKLLATRVALVHGDYSPKNVLVRRLADGRERLVLLDHEVIHWGDPSFDVGFALAHFISKAHYLRWQPGNVVGEESPQAMAGAALSFWLAYWQGVKGADTTNDLPARVVDHTLGCLLARVAGRSPLEYLDLEARDRQRRATLTLMAERPDDVEELITRFLFAISVAHD